MSRTAILVVLSLSCAAVAQESPTPTATLTPFETASPTPTPSSTPPTRAVQIRFVPPPMEGTISLGILDERGKLVRILHRQARIDDFAVEADSLGATWDGKNDAGEDAPPGRYHARGYSVGELKVEQIEQPDPSRGSDRVTVQLVENPLLSRTHPTIDLSAGSDSGGTFLRTSDGLPLLTLSRTPNAVNLSISKTGKRTVNVWQGDGTNRMQFRVSSLDQIMEFDCGTFDLK
jgi:hypothetical protein